MPIAATPPIGVRIVFDVLGLSAANADHALAIVTCEWADEFLSHLKVNRKDLDAAIAWAKDQPEVAALATRQGYDLDEEIAR